MTTHGFDWCDGASVLVWLAIAAVFACAIFYRPARGQDVCTTANCGQSGGLFDGRLRQRLFPNANANNVGTHNWQQAYQQMAENRQEWIDAHGELRNSYALLQRERNELADRIAHLQQQLRNVNGVDVEEINRRWQADLDRANEARQRAEKERIVAITSAEHFKQRLLALGDEEPISRLPAISQESANEDEKQETSEGQQETSEGQKPGFFARIFDGLKRNWFDWALVGISVAGGAGLLTLPVWARPLLRVTGWLRDRRHGDPEGSSRRQELAASLEEIRRELDESRQRNTQSQNEAGAGESPARPFSGRARRIVRARVSRGDSPLADRAGEEPAADARPDGQPAG